MLLELLPRPVPIFLLLFQELELKIIENVIIALDHLQLMYEFQSLGRVQIHRSEIWLYINFTLLLQLILGHLLHFNETLVHELRNIIDFEQDLGLRTGINELDELNEDSLNM